MDFFLEKVDYDVILAILWSEFPIFNGLEWIFFVSGIHYNQLESMGARCEESHKT